jgi:succinate dehydrogenase/fumarate reductase flavoprotein subunit
MVRYMETRFGFAFEPYPAVGPTLDYRFHLPGARHGGRSLDLGFFRLDALGEWAPRLRRGTTSTLLVSKTEYYGERQYMYRSVAAPAPASDDPRIGGGAALVAHLLKACLDRGVAVRLQTPAEEIVIEGGRVAGVRAGGAAFRARLGMVVATGGYEWNAELKRRFLARPLTHPASPEDVSRGDGLLLGMAVGAQVTGLGDAWWTPVIDVTGDGPAQMGGTRSVMCRAERGFPHSIVVNRLGRRFVNEALNYYDVCEAFGAKVGGSPRNLPAWIVFDSQGRDKYFALHAKVPDGEPPSYLTVADSLEHLAEQLGIDGATLAETLERFNGFARAGKDLDFGRGESGWDIAWGDPNATLNHSLGTVEVPPFYAVPIYSGALATKGGLRVNSDAQVLSALPPSAPIPGLYASGNCSNAATAGAYPGAGATIGAAMTFGYIAARHAAGAGESAADADSFARVGHVD